MKIGLALEGGGGKGAYQIGVMKAAKTFGLDQKIDVYSGTSVDGLNAALFAQGDFDLAEEVWNKISNDLILMKKCKATTTKSGFYLRSNEGLENLIKEYINFNTIHDNKKIVI